jgi:hypothetical protein
MEERVDVMTDNQYYGVWKTAWMLVYKDNPNSKVLKDIEALLRKQDIEELHAYAAEATK